MYFRRMCQSTLRIQYFIQDGGQYFWKNINLHDFKEVKWIKKT